MLRVGVGAGRVRILVRAGSGLEGRCEEMKEDEVGSVREERREGGEEGVKGIQTAVF